MEALRRRTAEAERLERTCAPCSNREERNEHARSLGFFFFFLLRSMRRCTVRPPPAARATLERVAARRGYAEKGGAGAFEAKKNLKGKAKVDAAGIAEYQRLAKLIKPEPFKVNRTPEEVAYATQLARIYNRNHQAEAFRLNRALHRMVRCRQAAIAALPTEAHRAVASTIDDEWYAERMAGVNRLLTITPPLPGYAGIYPEEGEELEKDEDDEQHKTR